jgi:hypothetical protein
MAALELAVCGRCRVGFLRPEATPAVPAELECRVCVKLGDRSLVWFMREMREATDDRRRQELHERFAAARGRSWNYRERQVMR